jgi:hypothetical protein
MRQFILVLFSSLFLMLLTACGGSKSPLFDQTNDVRTSDVRIAYALREELAPARWVFTVTGGEDIVSYQWRFSDDSSNTDVEQASTIEHVFTEPGRYLISLIYQTSEGEEGRTDTEVIIGSGSIAGTITAALDSLVDVDTRDPDEPDTDNDSFESAQVISATTRLSGVVDINDLEDFYQVQLQQFQRLNLQVADKPDTGSYGTIYG